MLAKLETDEWKKYIATYQTKRKNGTVIIPGNRPARIYVEHRLQDVYSVFNTH